MGKEIIIDFNDKEILEMDLFLKDASLDVTVRFKVDDILFLLGLLHQQKTTAESLKQGNQVSLAPYKDGLPVSEINEEVIEDMNQTMIKSEGLTAKLRDTLGQLETALIKQLEDV